MYRHKKTGNLYELVQERILFKDIDTNSLFNDEIDYSWRGKNTSKEQFVLYKAAYQNPDGPYFVRQKEDWDNEFEECINTYKYPLERTINDEKALYDIPEKGVKRYEWSRYYEPIKIYTLDEYKNGEIYTDEGEYEAYLTDGVKYLGTNIVNIPWSSLDDFIAKQEEYGFKKENIKIMFIDYPEDK